MRWPTNDQQNNIVNKKLVNYFFKLHHLGFSNTQLWFECSSYFFQDFWSDMKCNIFKKVTKEKTL
jgi:hypothetical protein